MPRSLNATLLRVTRTVTQSLRVSDAVRVVDGIKNRIALAGMNDKQAWKRMREVLNLDEEFLKYVTTSSKNPTHGILTNLTDEDHDKILSHTWVVVNRY